MTGHSDEIITKILWPDAEIDSLLIDYGEVVIRLTESSQKRTTVRCSGYIGYTAIGIWDEVIVEEAELLDTSDFQDSCLQSLAQRYGNTLPDSGDPARNRRSYRTLEIRFIDGTVLKIVAAEFVVE